MDRQIVCFGVPAFEIALARLTEPRLRNRPVGIASVATVRAVLHEVSDEAITEGLSLGMAVQQATKLCPSLRLLAPDPDRVATAHQALVDLIAAYAPVWEPAQLGSVLMDLTGTTKLFGPTRDTAIRLQRNVAARLQLDGVLGIGSNKLVARTAAGLVQPAQLYEVRHGSERAFMAPLPIHTLPLLHRPQMQQVRRRLADLNLQTFGDVANISLPALEIAVGTWAAPLLRWAQGVDSTPILPPPIQPHFDVSRTLEPDDIDDRIVWNHLADLLEALCRTLRAQARTCSRLTLTIRHSDRTDATGSHPVEPASHWEYDLTPPLRTLFHRCFRRRIRLRTLTLSAGGLTAPLEQGRLFDDQADAAGDRRTRAQRLSLALDRLRTRFGDQIVRYGRYDY